MKSFPCLAFIVFLYLLLYKYFVFSSFYVTGEFLRFLHRAKSRKYIFTVFHPGTYTHLMHDYSGKLKYRSRTFKYAVKYLLVLIPDPNNYCLSSVAVIHRS